MVSGYHWYHKNVLWQLLSLTGASFFQSWQATCFKVNSCYKCTSSTCDFIWALAVVVTERVSIFFPGTPTHPNNSLLVGWCSFCQFYVRETMWSCSPSDHLDYTAQDITWNLRMGQYEDYLIGFFTVYTPPVGTLNLCYIISIHELTTSINNFNYILIMDVIQAYRLLRDQWGYHIPLTPSLLQQCHSPQPTR